MQQFIGKVIKGYEIRGLFGEGGFGAVYRAYQPALKREVAIKVILPEYATDPDFIRRFEFEAEVIARLEHPHIVPLYDYWREADYAYLVMRALTSNLTVANAAERWTPVAIGRLLDQIASALAVAHRNNIIHRDIKSDNILLDEDRNAYLADFGIASYLPKDADGAVEHFGVGSLDYVSPEQLRRQTLSIRSDIFSLGIVLFQLLTGTLPFSSVSTMSDLITKQLEAVFPPLNIYRADLSEAVNRVIQRATDKNPDNRFPDALSMAAAYQQALSGVPAVTISTDGLNNGPLLNPYKGLRAFEEIDHYSFFGRKSLSDKLIGHLNRLAADGRFLAVIGPSGSGKSSVIRAGLLPRIRQGALPDSSFWFIVDMRPGSDPFASLEAAIQSVAVNPPPQLASQLQRSDQSLGPIMQSVLPADPKIEVLLVIDQFEEIFTQIDDEAARLRFLNNLVSATTDPNSRLRVVITLRADFVDRLLHYAAFGQLVNDHNEFVLPLSADELELAISGPAQQAGVRMQPDLVMAIISEVIDQPGALPLLQFALTELFEQQQNGSLTLDTYRNSGGVLGSVARQAETLYTSLDEAGQRTARQLLLRLVTPGEENEDTRRRVARTELAALDIEQPLLDQVLDLFSRSRLLTFDHEMATRRPTVEVAHEALIRTWPRLRDWVNDSRQEMQVQRRMLSAASEWITMGREASFLADGTRLNQFEDWASETSLAIGREEAEYLQASTARQSERQAHEQARRQQEARTARLAASFQRITVIFGVVGLLAMIALGALAVQVSQSLGRVQSANDQVATAQSSLDNLGLASEASKLLINDNGNVEVAALLGIRALKSAYLPEADSALREAIERDYTEKIYSGHSDAIYAVAISPDGKLAVSGGAEKTVRLWDIQSGKTLQVFAAHTDTITTVAFSPDGRYVATGSKDRTTRLWNITTGQNVRTFTHEVTPVYEPGPYSAVNSIAFSPDGQYLLAGTRETRVRLWNIRTGLTVRTFDVGTGGVFGVAFSPDGNSIVVGTRDNRALLWDVHSGQLIRTFSGHSGAVWAVAFSPDGKLIATGSGDDTARLWDVQSGQTVHVLQGHLSDVTSVVFSPDGQSLVTASADNTSRLWDVQTGQRLREFTGHTDSVWSAAFLPDGKQLLTASSDHTVRIWDAQPSHNPYIFASHAATVQSVAFSHDGRYILTGSNDQTAQLWDMQTKQNIRTFSGFDTPVYSVAFSPDDRTILTAGSITAVQLWDVRSGQVVRNYTTFAKSTVFAVAFSADGKFIVTGNDSGLVRIWDAQTGQSLLKLSGHSGQVESVAFSPDGRQIVSGSYDHTARVWDAASGQLLHTLADHTDAVNSVAFSPDGAYILTGSNDNTARLWDAKTGTPIRTFIGHTDGVTAVAFSADSRLIVTGSLDATLQLWDVQSGKSIRTFTGHTKNVTSVAFSPDQKYIVSGSADDTVRLWETDYRDFVRYACTRLTNDFTDNERLRFKITDNAPTCPQFASNATATPIATSVVPTP